MNKEYNKNLIKNSKNLRNNMTKEEKHLWYDFLKGISVTVHRQKVIGNYIVDFCIPSANLIIELDGSQHFEHDNRIDDLKRDEYLKSLGYKVLRYTNLQINRNFEEVCLDISKHITPHPSPAVTPSPQGEG